MKAMMILLIVSVSSQVFASNNLNDAFSAALKSSEMDHKNQQVALSVSPHQIEKATFKRDHTVHVVEVEDNMLTDKTKSAFDEPTYKTSKMNKLEGTSNLKHELEEI